MAVARTITCYVKNNVIQRMTSSDDRMIAGYFKEHNATKINFVITGDVWNGLLKAVEFVSPIGTQILPILLDEENSVLIPINALDGDGKLKFTLIGSLSDPDTNILTQRVKTGISTLPVLEALEDGAIEPDPQYQEFLKMVLDAIANSEAIDSEIQAHEAVRIVNEAVRIVNEEDRIAAETIRQAFYTDMYTTKGLLFSDGNGDITAGDSIHHQIRPARTWHIHHNRGTFPSVTVIDSTNNVVFGDITYVDEYNLEVNFTAAFSGKAYIV